jgi:hypothetical protein
MVTEADDGSFDTASRVGRAIETSALFAPSLTAR